MTVFAPFRASDLGPADDPQELIDRRDERNTESARDALRNDILTDLIGERMAEAVTSGFTYTAAQLRIVLDDARKHADAWARANKDNSKYV